MDDDPRSARKTKKEYLKIIIVLLNGCNDIELLDFIWRLLYKNSIMRLKE